MKLLIKVISNGEEDAVQELVPIEYGMVITIRKDNLHISRLGRAGLSCDLTCDDTVTIETQE